MPRMVVNISEEKGKGSVGGQRRVERRGVMPARSLNGDAARDPKAHKVSLSPLLPALLFTCCLPVDLKALRRECHETSAATDIANLKYNHQRQHCRMASPRCADIPNPDSPHQKSACSGCFRHGL